VGVVRFHSSLLSDSPAFDAVNALYGNQRVLREQAGKFRRVAVAAAATITSGPVGMHRIEALG